MYKSVLRLAVFVGLSLSALSFVQAQNMAQDPLLSRSAAVPPNVFMMFDDSNSMGSYHLYQYGTNGWGGLGGPDITTTDAYNNYLAFNTRPTTFAGRSPDVNRIYYDPRNRYLPRINADGTYKTAGNPASFRHSMFTSLKRPPTTCTAYPMSQLEIAVPATQSVG